MKDKKRKFFRRDDVLKQIADAFGGTKYPGERESVAEASDESFAVLGDFGGDWKKTDPSAWLFHDDKAVTCLSDDGFRYFLPAFLIAVFDQGKEINEDLFFDEFLKRLEASADDSVSGFWDKSRRNVTHMVLESVGQEIENDDVRVRVDTVRGRF